MTDLETIKEMLDRAGIEYEESSGKVWTDPSEEDSEKEPKDKVIFLTVERGYIGFLSQFMFLEKTGQLWDLGAYE